MVLVRRSIIFTVIIIATSCLDNTAKKESGFDKSKVNEITFEFSFKTNKSDVFRVNMNKIQIDELQNKNVQIYERVEPTTNYDLISGSFGEGNVSNEITINLGNTLEKTINVQYIVFKNNDLSMTIGPNEIEEKFVLNNYVKVDTLNGSLKTVRVKGKHFPTIKLKPKIARQLYNNN